jgi:hypothetical protein
MPACTATGCSRPASTRSTASSACDKYKPLADWIKKQAAAGDPFILDRGAKWTSMTMSGVDAEHLATRRFQLEDICRGVRVMPIMIGLAEKTATYASAEQMFLAHVVHTETPWGCRIEQSAEVSLLTEKEQADGLYIYIDFTAMMRGDYKSLNEALKIQRDGGAINANEWRAKIGMNPREDDGGDEYIVNGAMAPQMGLAIVPLKNGGEPANRPQRRLKERPPMLDAPVRAAPAREAKPLTLRELDRANRVVAAMVRAGAFGRAPEVKHAARLARSTASTVFCELKFVDGADARPARSKAMPRSST